MYIRQTNSTSTLLREQYTDALPDMYTIRTDYQSAGRGQAGNGWESEDGKNLLFSTLMRCNVAAGEQFRLTMMVSVAMVEVLSHYLQAEALHIKWPNDIYYGDKKLSGILVENTLMGGRVTYSIVGVGLNVNQQEFHSKAPNPVSMRLITGKEYDVEILLTEYLEALRTLTRCAQDRLKDMYMTHLYRREGWFPYVERGVNITPTDIVCAGKATDNSAFLAEIEDVTDMGELVLRTEKGERKTYHFKQIRFVI